MLLPLLLLLCTGVLAAAAIAVRRHVPDGKNYCWFIETDSTQVFFFFNQTRYIFNVYTPWQYCGILRPPFACTISSVGACAEPRRTSVVCRFFHSFFFVWSRVVPQPSTSTVGPDIPGILLLYDTIYAWHVFIHTVLLTLLPMLRTGVITAAAADVRRGVPDGKHCCWFIKSDSIQCFLSLHSKTMYL